MKKLLDLKRINKNEKGYTLIELVITIFIVGIVLTTTTMMLVSLVKTSDHVDTRRKMRQDLELSLEIMKRDLRNSDPALSMTECDPAYKYVLFPVSQDTSLVNKLNLVLPNSQATVTYEVGKTNTIGAYLKRTYTKSSKSTSTYLTSDNVDIQSLSISCSKLLKENKFLLIKVVADSETTDNNGKIVTGLTRVTGTTIRNVKNN